MAEAHLPGTPAPNTGVYYLVDRDGAPTGCTVWCDEGKPLPLVGVNGYGPLFYRCVDSDAAADAA